MLHFQRVDLTFWKPSYRKSSHQLEITKFTRLDFRKCGASFSLLLFFSQFGKCCLTQILTFCGLPDKDCALKKQKRFTIWVSKNLIHRDKVNVGHSLVWVGLGDWLSKDVGFAWFRRNENAQQLILKIFT